MTNVSEILTINSDKKSLKKVEKLLFNNMCVEVRDEGDGFKFRNLDNPTLVENIKKETGCGIHIMKSLCTQVEFRNDGKWVQIKIDLQ